MNQPDWLKIKAVPAEKMANVEKTLRESNLNTICENAHCPNLAECFSQRTATFLILGNVCTRNCSFCAVSSGIPQGIDSSEPFRLASAVKKLGLKHVVITSVTRDDLPDGGAGHFSACVEAISNVNRDTSIEVLIPDFRGNPISLRKVVSAKPDVINHNMETVARLYSVVRPGAHYESSLKLLHAVKEMDGEIYTKTGFMLGLGETEEELEEAMIQVRLMQVDFLTLGQYLSPSPYHFPVDRYVNPEVFLWLKNKGLKMGFKYVESKPLARSSYNARAALELLAK